MEKKTCPNAKCWETYSLEHVIRCKGGLIRRHDAAKRALLRILGEAFPAGHVVEEPHLLPVPPDMSFQYESATRKDGAKADIAVKDLWGDGKWAFLDLRMFDPSAKSYAKHGSLKRYEIHEQEKARKYGERVSREIGRAHV